MYAQLGTIVFEKLKTFTSLNKSSSAIYAEHGKPGKPTLQPTGISLDEITIPMRFHAGFPCIPLDEYEKLKSALNEFEILTLTWGNGKVEGNFVITELTATIEDQDAQGNIFSLLVNCTLREYSTVNKLQQEQDNNRKNAIAVGKKNSVSKKKVNQSTCPQTISTVVSKVESQASKVNNYILQQSGLFMILNANEIQWCLIAINQLCDELVLRGSDTKSCAYAYPDIKQTATQLKGDSTVLSLTISRNQVFRLQPDNKLLQRRVLALKTAARPLINQSITRK